MPQLLRLDWGAPTADWEVAFRTSKALFICGGSIQNVDITLAGAIVRRAQCHGLTVGVVLPWTEDQRIRACAASLHSTVEDFAARVGCATAEVPVLYPHEAELSHFLPTGSPGPAAGEHVSLNPVTGDEEVQILMDRVVGREPGLSATEVGGGLSGAHIYQLPATRYRHAVVVKIQPLHKQREELLGHDLISKKMPGSQVPKVWSSETCIGRERGAIIMHLVGSVGGSARDDLLGPSRLQAMEGIVSTILRPLHRASVVALVDADACVRTVLGREWQSKLGRGLADLGGADPLIVVQALARHRGIQAVSGLTHGDFHPRNLLRQRSEGDWVVIDFTKVDPSGLIALDYAALEVGLILETRRGHPVGVRNLFPPGVSPEAVTALYDCAGGVLRPEDDRGAPDAVQTVNSIRKAYLAEHPGGDVPYWFAIALYLLRQVSYPENAPQAQRELALRMSLEILRTLPAHG